MLRTLILLVGVLASFAAFAQSEVIIGADKPGGSYYLYGGGLASWINQHSKTIRATSETTRGSVENARLLVAGRIAFGLVNASVAYQQREGIDQFKGHGSDKLRGIAVLDIAPMHIVTFGSSAIKMLPDLAGKRLSIGAPGSGSANTANAILNVADLKGKVQVQQLGFDESASNLRDGNLDAFAVASALPVPSVVDLASTRPVVVVPLPTNVVTKLHQQSPSYQHEIIPGGTYPGIKDDIETVAVPSLLIVRSDVPDDVVTEFLSQMFSTASLEYMHGVYKAWNPQPAQGVFNDIGVPLHPAAERYYRDHGLLK